ncbi:hypothetical protein Hamer_G003772 [Homarus americanus]|uniref:Uncharacterized protein n=1 Tax=Homarus americanus TaxID=6706 RepID=A0A8J5TLU9_HOMAM|nr:hypothetical protein Hamer_G003772 [Homarus americanus]
MEQEPPAAGFGGQAPDHNKSWEEKDVLFSSESNFPLIIAGDLMRTFWSVYLARGRSSFQEPTLRSVGLEAQSVKQQ